MVENVKTPGNCEAAYTCWYSVMFNGVFSSNGRLLEALSVPTKTEEANSTGQTAKHKSRAMPLMTIGVSSFHLGLSAYHSAHYGVALRQETRGDGMNSK